MIEHYFDPIGKKCMQKIRHSHARMHFIGVYTYIYSYCFSYMRVQFDIIITHLMFVCIPSFFFNVSFFSVCIDVRTYVVQCVYCNAAVIVDQVMVASSTSAYCILPINKPNWSSLVHSYIPSKRCMAQVHFVYFLRHFKMNERTNEWMNERAFIACMDL